MNDRISRIRKTPMSQLTDPEQLEFILDGGGRFDAYDPATGENFSRSGTRNIETPQSHSGKDISKNLKRLESLQKQIKSNQEAHETYEALRANGLKNTVLFAELIDWVVMTIADEKRFRRKSSKTAYFHIKLESMAKDIEDFNSDVKQPFVPDLIEHNELPARLRSYADQFQERRKFLKQNRKGLRHATGQALTGLRWLVETQTGRKASPAGLAKILDVVLRSATAKAEIPPEYDFEASLKKIPSIHSLSATKR
jgi:hypothetical protein